MAAPQKPWERVGVNGQHVGVPFSEQLASSQPLPFTAGQSRPAPTTRTPPPIPGRQQRSTLAPGYGGGGGFGYGSTYGGYGGYGSYGGYGGSYSPMYGSGMYGGLGGGYGMSRFGMTDDYASPGGFAQQAEQSSRQAFQSIESVVQAFGSVAMMLESTFQALYNSFRAVVGVADNFSRMRVHFGRVFSALAALRALRWLWYRVTTALGLRVADPAAAEALWGQAAQAAESGLNGATVLAEADLKDTGSRSSWPIMLFFAIVIGGPWLLWRFLSSFVGSKVGSDWASGNDDHFVAVAEFDFEAENEDELSLRQGMKITLAPKELQPRVRGWLLASIDGKKTGVIPANYVKILGKGKGRRNAAPEQVSQLAGVSSSTSTTAPRFNRLPATSNQLRSNGVNESDASQLTTLPSSVSSSDLERVYTGQASAEDRSNSYLGLRQGTIGDSLRRGDMTDTAWPSGSETGSWRHVPATTDDTSQVPVLNRPSVSDGAVRSDVGDGSIESH